jgi:DNA-binding transcriptional MerR regulator
VQVIRGLRSLGLTLKEIKRITSQYTAHPDEPIEELVSKHIAQALARVEARIASLQTLRQRILDFGAAGTGTGTLPAELAALFAPDPRRQGRVPLDSPPTVRV